MLSIIFFVSTLAILSLGVVVLFLGKGKFINRFFFYLTISIAMWLVANFFVQITHNPTYLTAWYRLTYTTVAPLIGLLLYFSLIFPTEVFRNAKLYGLFSFIPVVLVMWLSISPRLIRSADYNNEQFTFQFGPYFLLFIIYTALYLLATFYILYQHYRNQTGLKKEQIRYVLIGIFSASVFAMVTDLLLPFIGVNSLANFGPFGTIFFIGATGYAIIAHRLFDIRVIIRKTVVFSGVLIFALVVYSIIVFAIPQLLGFGGQTFSPQSMLSSIIAAAVIALGLEPLRRWLTHVTDRFLFKGEYDPQEILHELAKSLGNVVDLDEALGIMMRIVVKNLRLPHAATVVIRPHIQSSIEQPNPESPGFEVYHVKQVGYRNPSLLSIEEGDILVKYFTQLRQLVVTEELGQVVAGFSGESTEKSVLERLQRFKTAVAIPMIIKDRPIGVTFFGPKLSGDSFSNQDLDLLQIVAAETASAIEKSRLYEEDQLKSEFVSIASHELLTPTAAIEGYLSMILDEKLVEVDEKAREYLVRVYTSARRLSQLVKDLLSVSRIEAGRIVVDRQPSKVDMVIDQVLNDLTPLAQERGITLQWEKPTKPLPYVFIDLEKLVQVLINLVSNAIKYNRAKGSITISSQQTSPKVVSVSVSDTGVGMTKEEVSRLFEKFYRTKSATEAAIQGSGLGLYITKKLIELMDGTVNVTSQVGKGSTFTITLPVAADTNRRIITGDPKLMSPDQKIYIVSKK